MELSTELQKYNDEIVQMRSDVLLSLNKKFLEACKFVDLKGKREKGSLLDKVMGIKNLILPTCLNGFIQDFSFWE